MLVVATTAAVLYDNATRAEEGIRSRSSDAGKYGQQRDKPWSDYGLLMMAVASKGLLVKANSGGIRAWWIRKHHSVLSFCAHHT